MLGSRHAAPAAGADSTWTGQAYGGVPSGQDSAAEPDQPLSRRARVWARLGVAPAYALAVLGSAAVTLLTALVLPPGQQVAFISLVLAVTLVSVLYGGLAPGVLALGLSLVGGIAVELLPGGDGVPGDGVDELRLVLHLAMGLTVCALAASLRSAQERRRVKEARLRMLLQAAPLLAWSTDRKLRITEWEGSAWEEDDVVGAPLAEFLARETPECAAAALASHQRALQGKSARYPAEWMGRLLQVHVGPLRDRRNNIVGAVGAALDSTAMYRGERALRLRHEITRALGESASLPEAIERLLAVLGEGLGVDVATYWSVDREFRRLHCCAVWSRNASLAAEFVLDTRSLNYHVQACLPGRVWIEGRPLWIADVTAERGFLRARPASLAGLRGGFWMPVRAGGVVVGVLEFLSLHSREPDAEARALLEDAARQLAEFGRRWKAEETNAQLATVLESTPDCVAISDLNGRPLYVNRAGRKMLGLAEDAALFHLRLADFSPSWAAKIVLRHAIPVALESGMWEGETALLNRKTGVETPVSQVILCHRRPDGTPEFLSTIARDMSERKRAEEQLELSHKVLQASGALVLVADAQGLMRYASPSVKTVLGYRPNEVLGSGYWDLGVHPPEQGRAMREYVARAAAGKAPVRREPYEVQVRHRDGSKRWLLWKDAPAPHELLIGVGHDITERKQMEEALAERERKFRAVAEVAIAPGTEKTEAGLQDVVAQVLKMCAPLAESRQVVLKMRAPREKVEVRMDSRRLAEALHNVVENALQHSPPGARVQVSIRRQRLADGGSGVASTVRDSGSGTSLGSGSRCATTWSIAVTSSQD